MTKEEFIEVAFRSGYCTKPIAREYCALQNRDVFTESDFSEVFRIAEQRSHKNPLRRMTVRLDAETRNCNYGRTTKSYPFEK